MKKYATVGEYVQQKKRTEKIWRFLALASLAAYIIFAALSLITDEDLYLKIFMNTWLPLIFFFTVYLAKYVNFVLNQKWLKKIGQENIADTLSLETPKFSKAKIYCGEKALFCKKIDSIIPYEQIIWAYRYQHSINGIVVERSIRVHTKSGNMFPLNIDPNLFSELMHDYICSHEKPQLIIGYGKEQKAHYKKIVKEYKENRKKEIL